MFLGEQDPKLWKGGGVVSGIANKNYLVGADSMSCRSFSLLPFFFPFLPFPAYKPKQN